jgi:hypothetical protein
MAAPFHIILRAPTLVNDPVKLIQAGEDAARPAPQIQAHRRLAVKDLDHNSRAQICVAGEIGCARGGVLDRIDAVEVVIHAPARAIAVGHRPTVGVRAPLCLSIVCSNQSNPRRFRTGY